METTLSLLVISQSVLNIELLKMEIICRCRESIQGSFGPESNDLLIALPQVH